MAFDIEASPDARTASVQLTLSNVAGVDTLLRSDLNGTRPVRLRADDLKGSGARTVTDYEPALAGRILYRAANAAGDTAQTWTQLPGAELPRFLIPAVPQFAVVAESVRAYSYTRASRATVHDVINRTSSLVAAGRLGLRAGRMELSFPDYTTARDLEDVLERGQTVLFRQFEHAGMDMYFHADSVAMDARPEDEEWALDISFLEIAFPSGHVLSRPDWTFDSLAQAHDSFDSLAQAYDSFHDVSVGGAA